MSNEFTSSVKQKRSKIPGSYVWRGWTFNWWVSLPKLNKKLQGNELSSEFKLYHKNLLNKMSFHLIGHTFWFHQTEGFRSPFPMQWIRKVVLQSRLHRRHSVEGAGAVRFNPANFLQRMLDENEDSGKDQFFGDPDWLSEIQSNKSAICGLLEPVLSRALCFRRACAVRRLCVRDCVRF